ncbi:MAG TPA: phospholipase D-like domain-containing protein [Acidimicrobiales bacterium]|nr:phospholipase D-like domain-containing protein [Acidimicrobiales bacterium]
MPSSRSVRAAAVGAGVALATYGWTRARFRRETSEPLEVENPPPPGDAAFARLLEAVTGSPVRGGNRVTILRNGDETFAAMLDAIAAAEETIDFSSYIYWPGDVTERFTDAFCERARAGVAVRFVVDGYGSARLGRSHVHRLEEAGVKVSFFRPPQWHTIGRVNNRMHRRLLVVDGRVGFAGGVGIADVWTGNAEDPGHWRETHARIDGPAVRDILGGFLESWTEAAREVPGPAHVPGLAPREGGVDVQVTRSSPLTGDTAVAQLFLLAVTAAQKRVWLTTAYFSAGRRFQDALCAAARRGVDVRILVNGRQVDKEVVRKTGQRSYGPMLESGVRIFEYDRTMLHAKTLVVDDDVADLGSSNFDYRSFGLDAELNVTVHDRAVAAELASHFLDDLEHADEIDLARWRSRPLAHRTYERIGDLARQSF